MTFLPPAYMANIQKLPKMGMTTPVDIQRRIFSDVAYGDDEGAAFSDVGIVNGWFFTTPTLVAEPDTEMLVSSTNNRLFLPVGTNIQVGDQAIIDGEAYVVADTTAHTTWPALLRVSLRLRE